MRQAPPHSLAEPTTLGTAGILANADIVNGKIMPLPPDYIAGLDVYIPSLRRGFGDRLIEQGKAHGHVLVPEHCHVVANAIGPEFDVTIIATKLSDKDHVIKG